MVKLVSHKQVSYSFHTLDYAVHRSRYITANMVILNLRISIKQRKGILSEFADFFFFLCLILSFTTWPFSTMVTNSLVYHFTIQQQNRDAG